jgi:hypothetical protein
MFFLKDRLHCVAPVISLFDFARKDTYRDLVEPAGLILPAAVRALTFRLNIKIMEGQILSYTLLALNRRAQ